MADKQMRIFYNAADKTGSRYYRMFLPARYLSLAGHNVTMRTNAPANEVPSDLDLYIVQRGFTEESLEIVEALKKKGVFTAYEIDDDVWSIPDSNPRKDLWPAEKIKMIEQFIAHCDAVIVSTDHLAEVVGKFHSKVVVVPNYVENLHISKKRKNDGHIRLGWAGGDSHEIDFTEEIVDALLFLKRKLQWELVFFGFVPESLMGKVRFVRRVEPPQYLQALYSMNLDLAVAPLVDVPFNMAKSNVKLVEYGSLGIPCVASDVGPYRKNMPGVLRVENTVDAWTEQLKALAARRKELGQEAFEYIQNNFLIKNNVETILGTYHTMLKNRFVEILDKA